jgi:hypothetical protein
LLNAKKVIFPITPALSPLKPEGEGAMCWRFQTFSGFIKVETSGKCRNWQIRPD